tara:strand:- start:953 stop:1246 length:294 start_codon:yes stop_codon:yes gene_type:complete
MRLSPRNRHLVIEPILKEEEREESAVLLPDDYLKHKEHPYVSAKVVEVAPDCDINVSKGDMAVVESRMLQEVEINNTKVYIILQNYVLGVLSSRSRV